MRKLAGGVIKKLWLVAALAIIVAALIVALGRELLPLVNRYQPQLNAALSRQLGLEIRTGEILGRWRGLKPVIAVRELTVLDPTGEQAIAIGRGSAQLDLLGSVLNLSPVWSALSVKDVKIILIEDAKGRWSVGGHRLGSGQGGLALVQDLMFYTRDFTIDNAELVVRFYSGSEATFMASSVETENQGDFHRTVASLALARDGDEAAQLIFEGRGDPADSETFTGRGYLRLQRLNFADNISAIVSRWFPEQVARVGDIETDLDLAFWFDWRDNRLVDGRGTFAAAEVPLNWQHDVPPLRDLSAEISGWYDTGNDWGFALRGLRGTWGEQPIEPLDMQFRQRVGRRWGELDVAVDRVNLATLNGLLLETGTLTGKARQVLSALNPAGTVRNLVFDLDFSRRPMSVMAKGNLEDVSISSWRNAPAARGVSGYFQTSGRTGVVELDSRQGLALHYPRVYDDYMPYGAVRGRVDWQWSPEDDRVRVTSGPISVIGEEGTGAVHLFLDLPTRREAGTPEMTLTVTMRDSDAAYVERYLPSVLNPGLRRWLDRALGTGMIPEAGFIWRGSLRKEDSAGRTVQVYARVRDAELDYQPGWPALSNLDATLLVDDGRVDVWAQGANLANAQVVETHVSLPVGGPTSLLRVDGRLRADAGDALELLRDSPVGERIPDLEGWRVRGQADFLLDLAIPLASEQSGERYRVRAVLNDTRLSLGETPVDIRNIQGALVYDLEEGLSSAGLEGEFLGQHLSASVQTGEHGVRVDLAGTVTVAGLDTYLGRFEKYLTGSTAVAGHLLVPPAGQGEPQLALASSGEGLTVDLPAPYGKAAAMALPIELSMAFGDRQRSRIQWGDLVDARWQTEQGRFDRGVISLAGDTPTLPDSPGLLIAGHLATFDWRRWQPFLSGDSEQDMPTGGLKIRLDFQVDEFSLGDIALGATAIGGQRVDGGWHLDIDSDLAGGRVMTDNDALQLRLERLVLPRPTATATEDSAGDANPPGFLERLVPGDIPALDFAVDNLFWGDERLGNLAFVSSRRADGVDFHDITGTIRGITLGAPVADDIAGARLTWRQLDDGQTVSSFAGTLSMGSIGDVFARWQLPRALDTDAAVFFADLNWHAKPWDFTALALRGYIGLDMEDGQFYRATNVATNTFFRLVSLLNFDTWLRRLRFDFTDLFNEGVSFDRVQGVLAFDRGMVEFDEPLVVSMPSGKIRLLGGLDLERELLNARLVATLPVGTNLPWVAGLVGGLPAAAGVYLTGKLFEKQVDKLSSISYRVTGSWEDPELEVDRIFSDKGKFE